MSNRVRVLIGVLVAAAAVGVAVSAAATQQTVTAAWSVVDHCTSGWCAGNNYTGTWTIVQKKGSHTLSGHDNAGNKLTGTITGARATWTLKGASYSFVVHATFAANGKSFAGTFTDSKHASGTTHGTRPGGGGTRTVTLP
ncbi:MAG TPA: hypothetical protein VMU34_04395 [Mycobacterium sp.]|nr:hypothetical protein [Mycobacterium sp.]